MGIFMSEENEYTKEELYNAIIKLKVDEKIAQKIRFFERYVDGIVGCPKRESEEETDESTT
jgi:hypothetical protein